MDTRGRNTWGTQQNPDITPPSRNSSTGEGGWALWRPLRTNTDRNTGRGPPEWNRQTKEAMAELRSSGGHSRWSMWPWPRSPRPGPYNRNPFTPPKISLGKLGGIRSPPGLNTDKQDRTSHRNRFHLHDKDESPWTRHDKTRWVKMFLWAQHDLKTALLAVTGGLDPRG